MSGSGLFDMNVTSNSTNVTFNCRTSELSSTNITDPLFWKIDTGSQIGATIVGVLLLIFFMVGLIWNMFIIITFFVKHQLLKEPANIFLLNVAINDVLICLTTMVFGFVTAFAQEFVFGANDITRCAVCDMSGFFLVFLILLSLHLLMALSIDRFLLLSRPLRYKRLMNRWKALLICAIVYIVCVILAILPLPLIGFGEIEFNPGLSSCIPRFTPQSNLIFVVVVAVEALIPIIILAITNVYTYRLVSKFLKRNFRRRSTFRRRDREAQTEEGQKHHKQQKQLVKVFSALLISIIITYPPTIVAALLSLVFVDQIPGEIFILGYITFLLNPVLHPIIESFFVKELRYQVNRARKGVRRVSTVIYRQTTQLFSSKALDEAIKKVEEDSTPTPKRSIRFLNGRVVDSVVTETEDIHLSRSQTPEPQHKVNGTTGEGGEVESGEGESREGENETREKPMLAKTRRSVTFDNHHHLDRPQSDLSPGEVSPHSGRRLESCLKRTSGSDIKEEVKKPRSGSVPNQIQITNQTAINGDHAGPIRMESLGFEFTEDKDNREDASVSSGSDLERTGSPVAETKEETVRWSHNGVQHAMTAV